METRVRRTRPATTAPTMAGVPEELSSPAPRYTVRHSAGHLQIGRWVKVKLSITKLQCGGTDPDGTGLFLQVRILALKSGSGSEFCH